MLLDRGADIEGKDDVSNLLIVVSSCLSETFIVFTHAINNFNHF
jgi:hypothetical protein